MKLIYKTKSFLGYIDRLGTSFEDKIVTTGFGIHLALPILRKGFRDDLTEEEARNVFYFFISCTNLLLIFFV